MIRTKRESLELFIKEQLIGPGGCNCLLYTSDAADDV